MFVVIVMLLERFRRKLQLERVAAESITHMFYSHSAFNCKTDLNVFLYYWLPVLYATEYFSVGFCIMDLEENWKFNLSRLYTIGKELNRNFTVYHIVTNS